jgi:tetratricopeptide (TPR) repeat protein
MIEPTNPDQSESEWVSEAVHENVDLEKSISNPLEDTQEIQVMDNQPTDMLDIAEKAIVGENYQFAVATLRKLVNQGDHINDVVNRVEMIIQDHPECSDLLIFLGELYTRQGRRTEALEVYKKAQKNILL